MTDTRDLLIEIGTEELPPKALRRLGEAFADEIRAGLEKQSLSLKSCHWFAAPRRLAVIEWIWWAFDVSRWKKADWKAVQAAKWLRGRRDGPQTRKRVGRGGPRDA